MQLQRALTVRLRRRGWRRNSFNNVDAVSPKLVRKSSNAGQQTQVGVPRGEGLAVM